MDTFVLGSGGAAVVSALVIQWLKKSNWFTFLSTEAHSQNANLIFSIVVALFTSLGLSYTYNAHTGQLIVNGLVPANMLNSVGHWFIQWTAQHVAYKAVVVPTELQ